MRDGTDGDDEDRVPERPLPSPAEAFRVLVHDTGGNRLSELFRGFYYGASALRGVPTEEHKPRSGTFHLGYIAGWLLKFAVLVVAAYIVTVRELPLSPQ